jgi:excinuclease UvrABC nuclease subunit
MTAPIHIQVDHREPACAQALLKRYDNIQNPALATSEDLLLTPSIGQDTAECIYWAVNCERA